MASDDDNPLRKALCEIGLQAVADKFIFSADEEEEQLARSFTVLLGVLQMLGTQYLANYERTLLASESDKLMELFEQSQHKALAQQPELATPIQAIVEAYRAFCRTQQGKGQAILKHANLVPGESVPSWALFSVQGVARGIITPFLAAWSTAEIQKLVDKQLPEKLYERALNAVVRGMKQAYPASSVMSEEAENSFRFYARIQLHESARAILDKRHKEK